MTTPLEQRTQMRFGRSLASILANPRPIAVALHFNPQDAPRLWDMASRHHSFDGEEVSFFAKAARATDRRLPVVFECSVQEQLEEVKSFFVRHGIEAPRVEELKI